MLRGSRLVDAEPGLLGLVAGYGSVWFEGWGRMLGGVLAACTFGDNGRFEASLSKII